MNQVVYESWHLQMFKLTNDLLTILVNDNDKKVTLAKSFTNSILTSNTPLKKNNKKTALAGWKPASLAKLVLILFSWYSWSPSLTIWKLTQKKKKKTCARVTNTSERGEMYASIWSSLKNSHDIYSWEKSIRNYMTELSPVVEHRVHFSGTAEKLFIFIPTFGPPGRKTFLLLLSGAGGQWEREWGGIFRVRR